MFEYLLSFFGCKHTNYSFPRTKNGVTYTVCLECGKERKYDFKQMRHVKLEKEDAEKLHCQFYGASLV